MKNKIKCLMLLAAFFPNAIQLHAQGYIVLNGILSGVNNVFVRQNSTNASFADYTGFELQSQTTTTFLFNPVVDEGVRTFLVSSNASISLQPIM